MGKGHLRHGALPPRPSDDEALVAWLQALARLLTGTDLVAAQRVVDGLGVRLYRLSKHDSWPSPFVGEGIPFRDGIWVKTDGDDKIIAVRVDDW